MPVLRVFLESIAHAGRPSGAFDTFVSVSEDELASGNHLRAAMRRASIRGFEAPFRIVGVRQLDFAGLASGWEPVRGEGRRADGAVPDRRLASARLGAA